MSQTSAADLAGKVVVVTGATGAAGPAVVSAAAAAGAAVVAVGRDEASLARLAGAPAAGPAARRLVEPAVCDLLDLPAVERLAAGVVQRHGRVDALVHLVGGWRGGKTITEADPGDWAFLESLLVRTLAHTSRAFLPALREAGGRLVVVSSGFAGAPTAKNAAYAAAKAAAEAWTLAVADALAGSAAAAVIYRVTSLVTPQMRAAEPARAFRGATDVEDLAADICSLWGVPADQLNGSRRDLTA